jgi:hypothetical protein
MARENDRRNERGNGLAGGGLLVGGIVAAALAPALLKIGRKAVRGIGGMRFISGVSGGPRPSVDPAAARPA